MKRTIHKTPSLIRVVLALGCLLIATDAFAQKVITDYDRSVKFSQYLTYDWLESKNPAPGFGDKRIKQAIDTQLQAKGLRKAGGVKPDLYVVYNLGLQEKSTVQGYDALGQPYLWNGGWVGKQDVTTEGTLVVDIVDAGKRELVWRSTATDTISEQPDENQKTLKRAAEKMFSKFPPKSR